MSAGNKGLLNRHMKVDQARHPLLYRWMLDNPYYWSEAAREILEAELAAGRVPVNLQAASGRANPKRPRGPHAVRSDEERAPTSRPAPVVQGPDSATQAADAGPAPTSAENPQASTPSANKPNKGTEENTYATEPAQQKAAPVVPEPPQQDAQRDRLRKLAEQTLLSNDF